MRTFRLTFLLFVVCALSTACVPKKKFEAESNAKRAAEEKAKRLDRDLSAATTKAAELENELSKLRTDYEALAVKSKGCEEEANALRRENIDLKKRNTSLTEELETTKRLSSTEREKLDAALLKKKEELDARERSIAELLDKLDAREKAVKELQAQLDAKATADEALRKELEAREKALQDLQSRVDARDKAMEDLRNKLAGALQGYNDQDLKVEVRDGKVYIAISDKMLFKSGSAKVEQIGKDALAKVAAVLQKYPDMNLIIEGHTDNVPIKTDKFSDNWDLSVIRATSVVRILSVDYGLAPTHVTASGRGEFFPKASNDSPEGRSKNRRTEIIIAPKLDIMDQILKGGH